MTDVAELLRDARRTYTTVRVAIRVTESGDPRRVAEATFAAMAEHVPFTDVLDVEKVAALAQMLRDETPEHVYEIWVERPDRLRQESGESVVVSDGERMSAAFEDGPTFAGPAHALPSFDFRWMLDPHELPERYALELAGEGEVAGRRAHRVRAVAAEGSGAGAAFPYAYQLDVDAERGIVLRRKTLLHDEVVRVEEVTQVAFDERFPPETFRVEEASAPAHDPPQTVDVARAAELVPFTLFAPPAATELSVEVRADPPGASFDVVHGGVDVHVYEEPVERDADVEELLELFDLARWETVRRAGHELSVLAPRGFPTAVRVDRSGTRIDLRGDLDADQLISLALSLDPVR